MDDREFVGELAEVQRLCKRMSPAQIKKVRKRLAKDLKARPPEQPTGIKVGDAFVRRDPTEGDGLEHWILRRRHGGANLLFALASCSDDTWRLVALMRKSKEAKPFLEPMDTWSGWHFVADPENITDQEWERLQDGCPFLPPTEAAAVEWVSPRRRRAPPTLIP